MLLLLLLLLSVTIIFITISTETQLQINRSLRLLRSGNVCLSFRVNIQRDRLGKRGGGGGGWGGGSRRRWGWPANGRSAVPLTLIW